MEIRDALAGDAPAICAVLRRSIRELCQADHGNDTQIVEAWLRNKTPENVAIWIANPRNSMLVATERAEVVAAACVTEDGEITLNYVSPDARFRGASKSLVAALEARTVAHGKLRCTLHSTQTAREFYLGLVYAEEARDLNFGVPSYRMSKALRVHNS